MFRPTSRSNRRCIAVVLLVLVVTACASTAWAAAPNFVFILADDQGWTGTSASMHPTLDARSDYYRTPNLERLAREGMRFTQGYAPAALCCPTRRSIQFGQTPVRQGDDDQFAATYRPGDERATIPRLLKSVNPNYRCAHFGKWDLRTDVAPAHLGYDEGDGNTGNGSGSEGDNGSPDPIEKKDKWTRHVVLNDPKRIFSLTERANDFMQRSVSSGQPFYVQISHYAVHADFQMRAETLREYERLSGGPLHHNPAFAAMTADLDTGIGQLLEKLDELGIAESTYVFYMADNGAVPWIPPDKYRHLANPTLVDDRGRNHPLRAGKWTLFEGGIRVPFVVRGPEIEGGSYCDVPVVGWDLLPTIADLAGHEGELPDDLDGTSFRSLLEQSGAAELHRTFAGLVHHRYSNGYRHTAIRVGDYKLIEFHEQPSLFPGYEMLQLYDLSADIGETRNLADENSETVEELQQLLRDYLDSVDAESLVEGR